MVETAKFDENPKICRQAEHADKLGKKTEWKI